MGEIAIAGAKTSLYNVSMVILALVFAYLFMYVYYELRDDDFDDDS